MALSANKSTLLRDGMQFEYGVKANAAIYQGALVQLNGNHVEKAAGATGKTYVGIAIEQVTGGSSDGDEKVAVRRRTAARFKQATGGRHASETAGTLTIGATAYVEDDETVTGINDVAVDNTVDRSELGKVVDVEDDGVWVYIE